MDDHERRSALARLRLRLESGERGATDAARTFLLLGQWATYPASDLRYLLRILGDAGIVEAGSPRELLAELFAAIADRWPANDGDEDGYAGAFPTCAAACAMLEECGEPHLGLLRSSSETEHPVRQAVRTVFEELAEHGERASVVRRAAHRIANLAGSDLPRAERGPVRAKVYVRLLERLAANLKAVALAPVQEATKLVACLEGLGMVRRTGRATAEEEAGLADRVAAIFTLPAQERPKTLERILLDDPAIDELFAAEEDLARVLVEWG